MLNEALQHFFGFDHFKPGQEAVIQSVLNGKNTLGVLPTGSGKSLCYQLPTYINQQPTLVISPLISLMDDQVMQMKMNGEPRVVAIHSGMTEEERHTAYTQLKSARFIFVSPEFILQPRHFKKIAHIPFGLIVLDEAHCLSEWGFDFRPHYIQIGALTKHFKDVPLLALTATAVSHLQNDIEMVVKHNFTTITLPMDRPNISLSVKHCLDFDEKIAQLLSIIPNSGPTIIYVSSKKICYDLAETIYHSGFLTGIYHADLTYQERHTVQQQFLNNDIPIIVATSAFGMGVNKPDIRTVIHFHLPPSPSNFIQEIGRAGRDGLPSQSIALYQNEDLHLMETLAIENLIDTRDIDAYFQNQLLNEEKTEILDQLSQVFNEQTLKRIFDEQYTLKQSAFEQMVLYVNASSCRRTTLLSYFHMSNTTETQCCDVCDTIRFIKQKNEKKVRRQMNYHEKLDSLFG